MTVYIDSVTTDQAENNVTTRKVSLAPTRLPLTVIVPCVFLYLPVTSEITVVLPAPDGPMIAVSVPDKNLPDTPSMTV